MIFWPPKPKLSMVWPTPGRSGSGKTTLLRILTKTFEIDELEEKVKNALKFEFSSLVDFELRLAFYCIFELASENGIKIVLSANGLDELFCGYSKYKRILKTEGEDGIKIRMVEFLEQARRNFEANRKLAKTFGITFIEPFLDEKFASFALEIPTNFKIKSPEDELRKHIIREVALDLGIPEEIALKPKKSLQYSSRIHYALKRLARRKGIDLIKARKMGFLGIREAYLEILKKEYPTATTELRYKNPLQLLIATILSSQCTDERVNAVTKDLFKKYKHVYATSRLDGKESTTARQELALLPLMERRQLEVARDLHDQIEVRKIMDISIADSGTSSVAFIGSERVGVDLEPLEYRDAETWLGLLGRDGYDLACKLTETTNENFDLSATRVWTLIEASKKSNDLKKEVPKYKSYLGGPWLQFTNKKFDILSTLIQQNNTSFILSVSNTNFNSYEFHIESFFDKYFENLKVFKSEFKNDPKGANTEKHYKQFKELIDSLTELERYENEISQSVLLEYRKQFQSKLKPFIKNSEIFSHSLLKPLGYAGDYQLLEKLFPCYQCEGSYRENNCILHSSMVDSPAWGNPL